MPYNRICLQAKSPLVTPSRDRHAVTFDARALSYQLLPAAVISAFDIKSYASMTKVLGLNYCVACRYLESLTLMKKIKLI